MMEQMGMGGEDDEDDEDFTQEALQKVMKDALGMVPPGMMQTEPQNPQN